MTATRPCLFRCAVGTGDCPGKNDGSEPALDREVHDADGDESESDETEECSEQPIMGS